MCVVCSCVVGWVVVVVGRVVCLSLLLTKSLSLESHLEPSCGVVSQVVSLVRSLLSLLVLVGCRYALTSSFPYLGWPSLFPVPCLFG